MYEDNFLSQAMENMTKQVSIAMNNALEEFIVQVQEDTKLSRKCAINYIHKYFDLEYDMVTEDDKVFLNLTPKWKSVDEIIAQDNMDLDSECLKEILDYTTEKVEG